MNLPDDLKDYKPLGAFQKFTGDQCVIILTFLIILAGICPEILK